MWVFWPGEFDRSMPNNCENITTLGNGIIAVLVLILQFSWAGIRSNLAKTIIRVYVNEINGGHFEHLQVLMLCCKKTYLYFVVGSYLFCIFNHVQTGGLLRLK